MWDQLDYQHDHYLRDRRHLDRRRAYQDVPYGGIFGARSLRGPGRRPGGGWSLLAEAGPCLGRIGRGARACITYARIPATGMDSGFPEVPFVWQQCYCTAGVIACVIAAEAVAPPLEFGPSGLAVAPGPEDDAGPMWSATSVTAWRARRRCR